MDAGISPKNLLQARSGDAAPLLIDVRREAAFRAAPDMAAGALRRDPATVETWAGELPAAAGIAVYCVHGHEVSRNVALALRDRGLNAQFVEDGLEEGLRAAGGALMAKPAGAATRWITRERPKVDRIACPWLISRFIDRNAEFLYVPAAEVRSRAAADNAIPYDIPDVAFSHDGPLCSFDAFIKTYRLTDPALLQLADIVRGADTGCPEIAPQSAGLAALSLGLSRLIADDHEQLQQGMVMYDALYLWCREGQDERHTWNPEALR
ncbi:MAG: chromate resistance protein ChrB domain-containing protein [Burkholderiales bacterium]